MSYLHKLNFDKIQNLIEKINSKIKLKRKVILAIDFSDKIFYGNKNNSNTIGSKGGKQVLRFIQLSSCNPNYFLNSFKVNPFTNDKKLLINALISSFRAIFSKTKIDLVLLDRGFFSKEVINYFCLNNLDFLMPAIKNKQIKKLILKFLEGKLPSKIKYKFGLVSKSKNCQFQYLNKEKVIEDALLDKISNISEFRNLIYYDIGTYVYENDLKQIE